MIRLAEDKRRGVVLQARDERASAPSNGQLECAKLTAIPALGVGKLC